MSNEQMQLVFWAGLTGLISCLMTGLGAIPVHFIKNHSNILRCFSGAFAAGMMISASVFSLAQEGIEMQSKFAFAPYGVMIGLLLGALFFVFTDKMVDHYKLQQHSLAQGMSRKGILVFISMFIHSIPEGIAIGVGFATGDFHFGLIMAIAIGVHNIPEGIAVSLPLKKDGASTIRCVWASILTSLPQPIMAVPAVLLATQFEPLLPIGLGFAGGAMIYLVVAELLPEALEEGGKTLTAWGFMMGLVSMLLISTLLNLLPNP
jgi:zinc transporter ZupT